MPEDRSQNPGTLKILVVDDELVIADTLVTILKANGFYAVARYNGIEALEQANIEPFDVLLTDVVMNGMNGIDSSREIRKIYPECRVILLSGNQATAQLLVDEHESGNDFEIFAKPVHPLVIIQRLQEIRIEKRILWE
jgi:CheY-like chemotaxis protein